MRLRILGGVVAAVLTATALAAPPAAAQPTAEPVDDAAVTATTDQLDAGQTLRVGQELVSPNGRWALVLETRGLFVVERSPYAEPVDPGLLWGPVAMRGPVLTWVQRGGITSAVLRADGNLVLLEAGVARASTGTAGMGVARLNVLDNGNVVLRNVSGGLVKHFGLHRVDGLSMGGRLLPGESLYGDGGKTTVTMQRDGNLVLRQHGRARWSSGTTAHPGAFAVMQRGRLVVRDAAGVARWSTGSGTSQSVGRTLVRNGAMYVFHDQPAFWDTGTSYDALRRGAELLPGQKLQSFGGDCTLVMQHNGNLVGRCGGTVLWASGTFFAGSRVRMQPDGNLVIRDSTGRARWSTATKATNAHLLLFGRRSIYDPAQGWSDMWSLSGAFLAVVNADTRQLIWIR